jgi:hypothetical protein
VLVRTTVKIILPLIGNVVPGNIYFGQEEILQRRKKGGTTHDPSASQKVFQYI